MNEDRTTDERLAAAAREQYHRPPRTPREEMWAAISADLEAERGPATGVAEDSTVVPLRRRRAGRADLHPWWIGIAAALVIGLGIGRWTSEAGDSALPVAQGPDTSTAARTDTMAGIPGIDAPIAVTPSGAEETVAGGGEDAPPARVGPAPEQAGPAAPRSGGLSYAVAAREHLARSETFLTGVRTDLERGETEADFGPWARSLLGRTRLLLASPAGRDPETRRLLEDLELMLAQIAVTAATGDSAEARIVDDGLTDGDLMYRLRSATEQRIGPGTTPGTRTSSL